LGAEVYGISVDSHFAAWFWANERKLTYPLLGDLDRIAIRAFDVELPELAGYHHVSNRACFVIDQSGTIVHKEIPERGSIPNVDAALSAVQKAAG
jgi:peroxiredoxin